MSQITRCPHCSTTFRVVADQLRISEGWVRCGHCKEVFDASQHLQVQEAEPLLSDLLLDALKPPPQPVGKASEGIQVWGSARHVEAPTSLAPDPVMSAAAAWAPQEVVPAVDEGLRTESEPPPWVPPPPPVPAFLLANPEGAAPAKTPKAMAAPPVDADAAPLSPAARDIPAPPVHTLPQGYELPAAPLEDDAESEEPSSQESAEAPAVLVSPIPTEEGGTSAVGRAAQETIESPEMAPSPAEPLESLAPSEDAGAPSLEREEGHADDRTDPVIEPGFVKAARRNAFWRRPSVRVGLSLVGLTLVVALLLQIAIQERDDIASRHPVARAWMERLCGRLQCVLQPPRHITAVVIDSSSFLKARHDPSGYQLQMSVKNTSTQAVAMPALELTLTDAQDQPIVRRVLLRDELGAPLELAPGFVWSGALPLQVIQGAAQVAGYRLVAFYP